MKFILMAVLALCLIGCGGGDDPSAYEDNRVCVINDAFNNQPDVELNITEEADEAGLDVVDDALTDPLAKDVSVCGDPITIDSVIASDDFPNLSDFLATGRKLPLGDSEAE